MRLAVTDSGKIVAAASVAINRIRGTRYSQLLISRGPVTETPTAEMFEVLGSGLRRVAADQNALHCRIEAGVPAGSKDWVALLRRANWGPLYPPSQARSTWLLGIEGPTNDLLKRMRPKWRYNIGLAQKKGVEVRAGNSNDVETFYKLYQTTSRRDGFFIHPLSIYREVFHTYAALNQLQLLFAWYRDEPVAAVSLLRLGNVVWYLYGASSDHHRSVMAPHLLQWEGIQWAKSCGARTYDFRGVPDLPAPGQEMYGVFRFKQGFGGEHFSYMEPYVQAYHPVFHVWRSYWEGRFLTQAAMRASRGQPVRTWA